MTLYKMVDGERLKMSAKEEAAMRAEWESAAQVQPIPVRTIEQVAADLQALQTELLAIQNLAQLQDLANG